MSELTGELKNLADAACDGILTAGQRDRLEELLRSGPSAQWQYVSYLDMHAGLRWRWRGGSPRGGLVHPGFETIPEGDDAPAAPHCFEQRIGRNRHRTGRPHTLFWRWGAIAAAIVIAVAAATWTLGPRKPGTAEPPFASPPPPPLATLTNSLAARWAGDPPAAVGDRQLPAVYHLLEGGAEVTLANGTLITLEAPCRMELLGPCRAFLHEGRVVAYVPNRDVDFIIDTPTTSVKDLGTEFGVGVASDGQTLVQVFNGKVVATAKARPSSPAAVQQLTAGQALRVGKTAESVPFGANRFIRWLPDPERREHWHNPRNVPRLETAWIPTARKPVQVDGDLADWDMAHAFEAACGAPYNDDYHVKAAMMYDDTCLYIAAMVADPAPMRSVIDPLLDPESGWRGGGVQLRLLADRGGRWPSDLRTKSCNFAPDGKPMPRAFGPRDLDERVLHLTLWYFEPRGQACLQVAHGMDCHGGAINPAGFQGAFRKLDDGRGYAMEYAVPWQSLGLAADRPRAGDVLPASWLVHWSDEGGRNWRGKLVEIHNLSEMDGIEFWRAATWGKVQFLP